MAAARSLISDSPATRSMKNLSQICSLISDSPATRSRDPTLFSNLVARLIGTPVMEWVVRERPYRPKEPDYSYLLEFTTKLHGISQGEKLFSHVPLEFQNELLYNNLVMACLDKGVIRLSLAYMRKMRELGHPISYLVFNRLIILHSSPRQRKIIPGILTQMKADKVALHVSTYNILMKIEANEHNIEGLLKVFGKMKQQEVEPNEASYCILATAHAVSKLYTVAEAYLKQWRSP